MRNLLGGALAAPVILLMLSACRGNPQLPSPRASPAAASSVIASFGKIENFVSFEKTESILGWRVLRPSDPKYIMGQQGGALRTLPSVKLPRLEQVYSLAGHGDTGINIVQEPEAYGNLGSSGRDEVIGRWNVNFRHYSGGTGVVFYSGEMVNGQRVVVLVTAFSDYSVDEVRAFVASLAFAS